MKQLLPLLILGSTFTITNSAFSAPERFKLYNEPRHVVQESCDVYTELKFEVSKGGRRATAALTNRLAGVCELHVEPNPRSYTLTKQSTACGSIIYKGISADGSSQLEMVDHRLRTCRDIVEAKLILKEISSEGTVTLYSHNEVPKAKKKFYCSNVGGTEEWTIYVDLNKKLAGFFDNDRTVVIPFKESYSLKSLPPQEVFVFAGKDTAGDDGDQLEIHFNRTLGNASVTFDAGQVGAETLEALDACVASDDIELELE